MATVLIVDNEERNLRLLEAMLIPQGYDIRKARDGMEALESVEKQAPDVVLLDVMMPKLDGFAVARRLKDNPETARIPVVMVTALWEASDRVRALEAGADDFLTKPVDRFELTARVKSLVKVKAYNDYIINYQRILEAEVGTRTNELKDALSKVKSASLETIYRLSRAAEYKDEDTGNHIQRVSRYSACIASKMGLNDQEIEVLLHAAPLHDIGKIGVPDKILLKSGKLSDEEWRVMKTHTSIGARILGNSDTEFIKLGAVIALRHHEKWDGSGYPEGLKGETIPLAVRIVSVADVFDALTSRRPYRHSVFTDEEACSIIGKGRGTHFDPEVLAAFEACREEVLAIKEQNTESTFRSRYFDIYQETEAACE